jgi:hypothetical protein
MHTVVFALLALVLTWILLFWLARYALKNNTAFKRRFIKSKEFFVVRWLQSRQMIVVLAKQLLGFFQIVLLLQSVYRIPFPRIYVDVLSCKFGYSSSFNESMRLFTCTFLPHVSYSYFAFDFIRQGLPSSTSIS